MGSFVNGDIVLVRDFDGYPMGRGFINTNSKITVRMLTRDERTEISPEFLKQRVRDAWEYRKKVVDTGSCRVIFGEADFLPGLVVDKFSDVLVVQSLALGIDRLKGVVVLMCFSASYRIAVVAGVIWLVVLFAAYQITQKRA